MFQIEVRDTLKISHAASSVRLCTYDSNLMLKFYGKLPQHFDSFWQCLIENVAGYIEGAKTLDFTSLNNEIKATVKLLATEYQLSPRDSDWANVIANQLVTVAFRDIFSETNSPEVGKDGTKALKGLYFDKFVKLLATGTPSSRFNSELRTLAYNLAVAHPDEIVGTNEVTAQVRHVAKDSQLSDVERSDLYRLVKTFYSMAQETSSITLSRRNAVDFSFSISVDNFKLDSGKLDLECSSRFRHAVHSVSKRIYQYASSEGNLSYTDLMQNIIHRSSAVASLHETQQVELMNFVTNKFIDMAEHPKHSQNYYMNVRSEKSPFHTR